MSLRLPFFGLLTHRSPMDGLTEHYDKIAECIATIDESLECYVSGGVCREFEDLTRAIDEIENHADKIKRNIRNHLPRGLFMPVDKTTFLNYTKFQDNILDSAQDALHWLAMRKMAIPEEIQKDIIYLLDAVARITVLLGPALKATIAIVGGGSIDREGTKDCFRKVREERDNVRKLKSALEKKVYAMEIDFKDIYQLLHFIDCLDNMAHNTENCGDQLRVMIAR
ncbi:TIGR00153 family protein [Pseudodesulfovibrio sp.]|uniref:TIGR00153 family protein n=1 Tax=unclassified Pseudodesulfovibrio TaxID=2661612 RepID=UPI003B00764C